jgi:hypothetical protein
MESRRFRPHFCSQQFPQRDATTGAVVGYVLDRIL